MSPLCTFKHPFSTCSKARFPTSRKCPLQSCNIPKQGRILSDNDATSEGGKTFSSDDEPAKPAKENGPSVVRVFATTLK
jgi:hypothetical protein